MLSLGFALGFQSGRSARPSVGFHLLFINYSKAQMLRCSRAHMLTCSHARPASGTVAVDSVANTPAIIHTVPVHERPSVLACVRAPALRPDSCQDAMATDVGLNGLGMMRLTAPAMQGSAPEVRGNSACDSLPILGWLLILSGIGRRKHWASSHKVGCA